MHDLQAIIDGLPGIYLIVAADAEYTMVASSDERLRVTMTRREDVIGKPLFEVFATMSRRSRAPAQRRCAAPWRTSSPPARPSA